MTSGFPFRAGTRHPFWEPQRLRGKPLRPPPSRHRYMFFGFPTPFLRFQLMVLCVLRCDSATPGFSQEYPEGEQAQPHEFSAIVCSTPAATFPCARFLTVYFGPSIAVCREVSQLTLSQLRQSVATRPTWRRLRVPWNIRQSAGPIRCLRRRAQPGTFTTAAYPGRGS